MGWLSALGVLGTGTIAALTIGLVAESGPAAATRAGGTIVGIAKTKEAAARPVKVTIDPGICGQMVPDESVVIDSLGGLANVVVSVPGVKAIQPAESLYTNEKCRFVPRVSLMRPNGAVKMTSRDATLHTMHAAGADGRAFFNVSIPVPNITLSRPVDKPGVVTLSCSTHTWMRGHLVVTDELTAISGADGGFKLEAVPAGTHVLRVWHETLKVSAPVKVTVKDGETVKVDLSFLK